MSISYFSHDSNARNSKKLLRLRKKHGAAGYGVYFMLIERLTEEPNFTSDLDYDMLAFDLHVKRDLIRSVVENFDLFEILEGQGKAINKQKFRSSGLMERMELRAIRSAAGRRGAASRWNNNSPDSPQSGYLGSEMAPPEPTPQHGKSVASEDFANGKSVANVPVANSIKENNNIESINNNPFFYVFPFFSVANGRYVDLATLAYLVLERNMPNAEVELEQIIAYNEVKGRVWRDMKIDQRIAAAKLWTPRKLANRDARFSSEFVTFWSDIIKEADQNIVFAEAKWEIIYSMLADDVDSVINIKEKTYIVKVSSKVYEWMEGAAIVLRDRVKQLLVDTNTENFDYSLTDRQDD